MTYDAILILVRLHTRAKWVACQIVGRNQEAMAEGQVCP